MKKSLYALALVAVAGSIAFTSCKKDDDNNNSRTGTISRTWRSDFDAEDSTKNGLLDESEKYAVSAADGVDITFNSDGTVSSVDIVNPGTPTIGKWSFPTEQTLRVIESNDTIDFKIHTLNNSQLILEEQYGTDYYWLGFKAK